jgi:hypothetical protein
MNVYATIRQAILNKDIVVATYNGHVREMCPHAIGTRDDGREWALFYQFAGGSGRGLGSPGSPDNWRCIPVDGLSNVSVRRGSWHTGTDYAGGEACVGKVDEQVRY